MNGWFDTHAHFGGLDDAAIAGLMERAGQAGVRRIVAVGHHEEANRAVLRVAQSWPGVARAAIGFDRDCAVRDPDVAGLELQIRQHAGAVVAIGELGLDYHYSGETRPQQMALMERELELARRLRLPVIIHSREARADTLALCRAHASAWGGDAGRIGVLHCFTEDMPFARALLDLGFHISFSGIVSFRNADPLRAVAREIPADRLLLETDTPYLAPVPHRGKSNEPAFLPAVGACVARVRGVSEADLAAETSSNAVRLFGWGPDGESA